MSSIGVRVLAGATLLGALLAALLPVKTTNLPQRSQIVRLWVCTLDPGVAVTDNGIRVLATLPDVRPGQRVLVRARLDPLDDARNPGEPSERAIQGERGISGRLASVAIMRIDRTGACPFSARLAALRAAALDHLRAHLAEPGASIVAGELWGDRSAMSPQLRAEFQETGTVHVLVTAGLHVGLIAMLLLSLLSWMRTPRWIACAVVAALVWAFALFSGGNLPALRAASMATVLLAARGFGRATLSWNTLALSAIFVLLIEPASVLSASFWLSFCCVGSIFALAPVITPMIEPLSLPHRIQEAITLTLATQIGTWPITAAVFLQFSTYGLIANLFVVPLVPITMILGAVQLAASGVPPLARAIANLNAWPLAISSNLVQLLASLPAAAVPLSPAPLWCIAFYESSILAAATLFTRGARTAAIALMIVAISFVLAPPRAETSRLKITVLDVGQADAIVIETPAHHTIVVDAGGRLERGPQSADSVAELVGERIVVPFLLRENIHALDTLIISHPHGDHVGGCRPVLRKIYIAQIADSGQAYSGQAYRDCIGTAVADHVPIVQPRAGMVWRTPDGVTLTFIGPWLPFIGGKNAINDNSVAFILQYKRFRMLFTGDAGVAAEQRFLDEGIDLHADVLKVGHHGSAYSSSLQFIAAVHPRYAIISVGRHNLYGHPAPSTIETLERAHVEVFRTDRNGAAIVTTDGASLTTVRAFLNQISQF